MSHKSQSHDRKSQGHAHNMSHDGYGKVVHRPYMLGAEGTQRRLNPKLR